MKSGDVIKYIPTGELHMIVCHDNVEIIPNGKLKWLRITDCELQRECSEEEHIMCIQEWATNGTDIRKSRCTAMLEKISS